MEITNFPEGATIFTEGAPGDALYVILKGEVTVTKSLKPPKGRSREKAEKVIATLHQGDFFGEMALLDEAPRSAAAKAKTEVRALKISRDTFWDFVKSDAASALQTILYFSRVMSDRLRLTTMELAIVFELSKIFSSTVRKQELCQQLIDQIRAILPEGGVASLALWNEFNEEFEWISATASEKLPMEIRRNFARSEPLVKILEEKHAYFLSENWKEESRLSSEERKRYGDQASLLVLPLFKSEDTHLLPSGQWILTCPILGLLYCFHPDRILAFDRQLIHLLTAVAHLSSTALENAAHREEEKARSEYVQRRQSPGF